MGNNNILYVEDNHDNMMLVKRALEARGYRLLEAANGLKGLDVAEHENVDLILMDINLPVMDGYTLTARLKTLPELDSIPIIALTANVMRGDRERTLEAGCDGYIQKPVDVDVFPMLIARFLQAAANAQEKLHVQ